jgi:hypothetical protein
MRRTKIAEFFLKEKYSLVVKSLADERKKDDGERPVE